jgi:hypothetical protein
VRLVHSRVIVEIATSIVGSGLVAAAVAADRQWLDSHFLPSFFSTPETYVEWASWTRLTAVALGATLALVLRPRFGRLAERTPLGMLASSGARVALALVLAVGTSELVLEHAPKRAAQERPADEEPRRQRDASLGWIFQPSRVGQATVGGRRVEYAFDASGYRVRGLDEPIDYARPTLVFTGESSIVGHGLNWEETVPAQAAALLSLKSANLAVHGFANDQAFMRLERELPRFARPVAVVSLFMPALFDRNLDEDRPHLSLDLQVEPSQSSWRLWAIASRLVPYRTSAAIERGIATTRAVLRATAELARTRGAAGLLVVPQFGVETDSERALRRRILDDAGIDYLRVPLDPSWRIPNDGHPDPRAARAIAEAIASELRTRPELRAGVD